MNVKPHHPLMEFLAKLLFGIGTVPFVEQRRMVNRACKEAVKWHEEQVGRFEWWVYDMEKHLMDTNGMCPECGHWIVSAGHASDCDVLLLVNARKEKFQKNREKDNEDSIS